MRITSIEEITWKTITPEPGTFPCFACHGVNGNATHFVHAEINSTHIDMLKLPVCEKCAEYARTYPDWLEEMLFKRRMEAAKERMSEKAMLPVTVPAMVPGF